MRIAQIAPLHEAVPPKFYGGTERVVSYLTEALVEAGHDVTLFASGDSQTSAKLEAFWPQALRLDPTIRDTMAPKLHAGDPDGAVIAGVDSILATIGGEPTSAPAAAVPPAVPNTYDEDNGNNPVSVFIGIVIGLVIVVLTILALGALARALPDRGPYISGGNSGFGLWGGLMMGGAILGGLGGGGFSGGGGMSGGGGATGRW